MPMSHVQNTVATNAGMIANEIPTILKWVSCYLKTSGGRLQPMPMSHEQNTVATNAEIIANEMPRILKWES